MIYTIGETVLDIIFNSIEKVKIKPGGSMLNTAVSLGRLRLPVSHISITSTDKASDMLIEFLDKNNVNCDYFFRKDYIKTNLALAHLDQNNNAEYSFYKDKLIDTPNLKFPECTSNDLILFGSFYSLNPIIHNQLSNFLIDAKAKGAYIIYDPNFRKTHLDNLQELKPFIISNLEKCNLVKASNEDFENIFGVNNSKSAWKILNKISIENLVYTKGKQGAELINNDIKISVLAKNISTKSTIGAGDTFSAGIIFYLHENFVKHNRTIILSEKDWKDCLELATEFSSQTCQSYDNYISHEFANKVNNV
ncbi:MAG: fructokinase [Salinivirgaceae bacterium]|nr:fructokinase [Salinivirgaceae bacterium]